MSVKFQFLGFVWLIDCMFDAIFFFLLVRCDYLDICGEPEFMEQTEMKYHEQALETGSLVVSACGFDSIPAELGLMFNSRQWIFPASPNRVEAYLSLESDKRIVGNFGTYESAVLGVANAQKRSRLKRARPVVSFLGLSLMLKKWCFSVIVLG